MTRNERDDLLRRFLDGELDSNQEHDFYINVALDKELRMELKAHQTIDSAMQKDRTLDPMEYAPMETAVAGMLASIPRNPMSPSAPVAMPVTPQPASALRELLSRISGPWFAMGILTLLAVTLALVVISLPSAQRPVDSHPATQQQQQPTDNETRPAEISKQSGTPTQDVTIKPEFSASPSDAVHQQQKHSSVDRAVRPEKARLTVKGTDSGYRQTETQSQSSSSELHNQQSSERAQQTTVPPEQHVLDGDSVKASAKVQLKNNFPK